MGYLGDKVTTNIDIKKNKKQNKKQKQKKKKKLCVLGWQM